MRHTMQAVAGVLFAAVGLGCLFWLQLGHLRHTADAGIPRLSDLGGPFELLDHTGRPVTERDFLGRPVVLFFGYSYCPDVCPTDLQIVADALEKLGSRADEVQALFISIDPARDTPAQLAQYTALFSPRILGLTGSEIQVARAAAHYRAHYAKAKGSEGDAYTIDHTAYFYVLDRQGRVAAVLPHATPAERLAGSLLAALRKSPAGS